MILANRIIIEIAGGVISLLTIWQTHILTGQLTIVVAIIGVIFLIAFEQLNTSLHPMINAVAEIQKHLSEGKKGKFVPLFEIKAVGYVEVHSPINITAVGQKMLEESGGKRLVDEHYFNFEAEIDEHTCKTAYDVQIWASNIIANIVNEPYMKPVKDFVYTHPQFENLPLMLEDAQRVMVIYLRNIYLEKHPDILPTEEAAKPRITGQ